MSYASVQPNSQRPQYLPGDSVDFIANFAGREIITGSVRISGRVVVTKGANFANPMDGTEAIYYDPKVGAHALFQTITTSFSGVVKDHCQAYPRYVKHHSVANEDSVMCVADVESACSLKLNSHTETPVVLATTNGAAPPVATTDGRSFSIKPMIGINSASGNFGYSRVGETKISLQVSTLTQFLYGADAAAATTPNLNFYLTDLQLHYRTLPDSMSKAPLIMNVWSSLKQVIGSNNTNLSMNVPLAARAVSCSFINLANENTLTNNFLQFDIPTNVSRVEFAFNDSTTALVQFPLEDQTEIFYNALRAMAPDSRPIPIHALKQDGKNFMLGISYEQIQMNTKIAINIQSGVTSANPLAAYLYFLGAVQV